VTTSTPPANSRFTYWLVACAAIILFMAANFLCLSSFPVIWQDEAMQVDPAVNLVSGLGWCSRAWFSQSAHEFWAANNPLYPALLSIWIKLFGTSLLAVRSFNLFQFSLVTALLLSLANRLGFLRKLPGMLLFITVLACSGLMSFIYRSGRADLTTMLVCSAVAWSYIYARTAAKFVPLFLASLFVIASGIQALPYLAALALADWLIVRHFSKGLVVSALGIATGGIALFVYMLAHRVLAAFVSNTFVSNYSLLGVISQFVVFHDKKAQTRLKDALATLSPSNVWQSMTADAVLVAALIALAILAVIALWKRDFRLQSPLGAGLLLALVIPVVMTAAGRYAVGANYYYWMSVAPLALCAAAALESPRIPRPLAALCGACLVVGALFGLPRDMQLNLADKDARDYAKVVGYLHENISAGTTIYADSSVYYAAKTLGYNAYLTNYGGGRGYPKVLEADTFSALVIPPSDLSKIKAKIGGDWQAMPEALDTCPVVHPLLDIHGLPRCYQLSIYKRIR
jgi:hypothetical protein